MSAPSATVPHNFPLELHYSILDILTIQSGVYDPSDPFHCYIHHHQDRKRRHDQWAAQRRQLRPVCRAWNHYLASPEMLHFDASTAEGCFSNGNVESRQRIKFLYHSGDITETSCNTIRMLAPNAMVLQLRAADTSATSPASLPDSSYWLESSRQPSAENLHSLHQNLQKVGSTGTTHNPLNFPHLISLTISTITPVNRFNHAAVSLASLRILELRLDLTEENAAFPHTHWHLPSLRHLFLGRINDDIDEKVREFLVANVGAQLETFEWDCGLDYVDLPHDLFIICPHLHTLITDLSRIGTCTPTENQAQSLRRIIHTG